MTRIGASQVFFNVVAQWNADKMIQDSKTQMTVMKAVVLDSFEAMMKPVDEFTMGLNNMVQELSVASQALGMAQVEFEKFFGSENIESASDELIAIGEAYAVVGHEALNAGSRAAQVANLIGKENVGLLVDQANILSNISDLNAEQAQRGMIQLQQQTGLLYGQRSRAEFQQLSVMEKRNVLTEQSAVMLDTLNTIANRSVAMEGDLVKTLSNFAAQGNLVGESFEFMAAASATLLEAGEEQGASGRALRMMYARLGGNISGTRDKLEAMGVATKDASGELLTMEQFMKGLIDGGYKQLNSEQKQNIAQVVSGNRHYVRFIKLMENYDRVTQLAADGAERLDSAQQQSARAMESQTMQLERQRTIQENLQAKMGQQMTPFMIGQLQATNHMNEAYAELMDIMPTFGNLLGRLVGSFEKFEGFLTFSIGMQSMAIGFEMMDSVQRSLHGILIANENLHSKQATYMASGVQASESQNQIMNAIRYQSQVINALQEKIRTAKQAQLVIDHTRLPLLERQAEIEKHMRSDAELRVDVAEKQRVAEFNLKTLSDGRLNDSTKISRMILNSVDYAKQLHATFTQINESGLGPMSVSQERLASQMLVNSKVANDLSEKQTRTIRERVVELRREHTVMQMLKAENQIAFQARSGQGGPFADQQKVMKELSFSANDMKFAYSMMETELERIDAGSLELNETLDKQKAKLKELGGSGKAYDRMKEAIAGTNEKIKSQKSHTLGVNEVMEVLQGNLDGTKVGFDLSAKGMHVFTKMMTKGLGEMIELTKILDMQEVKEMDLVTIRTRRKLLTETLNKLDKEHINNVTLMKNVLEPLVDQENEYARLQDIISTAEVERVDIGVIKDRLIRSMTAGVETLNQADRARLQVTEKLTLAQAKASQTSKRFTMQLTSAASIIGGTGIGGLSGAMTTALMQFSMLVPVLQGVGSSLRAYMKTQGELLLYEEDLAWYRRSAVHNFAKMALKIGAVVAIMYTYTTLKEKELELQKEITKVNESQTNVYKRMTTGGDEMLIQNQELAELLGIQGVKLKDLRSDEQLRLRITQDLTKNMKDFTGENRNAVEEALALATAVGALNTGMSQLVELQRQQTQTAAYESLGTGFGQYITDLPEAASRFYGDIIGMETEAHKQHELIMDLQERMGDDPYYDDQMITGGMRLDVVEDYIDYMSKQENAIALTRDELDLLNESFDDAPIMAYITGLNNVLLASGDVALMTGHLDGEFGDVNATIGVTSAGLENLTEEIYQFSGAREELFFGGKYGNVTGSLYKQVVTQGVGTLYNKNEVIVSNNFHGFFNEQEAADKIIGIVTNHLATV